MVYTFVLTLCTLTPRHQIRKQLGAVVYLPDIHACISANMQETILWINFFRLDRSSLIYIINLFYFLNQKKESNGRFLKE